MIIGAVDVNVWTWFADIASADCCTLQTVQYLE
jgi:hypothetical protein